MWLSYLNPLPSKGLYTPPSLFPTQEATGEPTSDATTPTPTVDAVAIIEAKKKKQRQERNVKIVVFVLIGIVALTGIYFMTRSE